MNVLDRRSKLPKFFRAEEHMSDHEKQMLYALRAVDGNALGLQPKERRVLRGCAPRLAQALVFLGCRAPYPLKAL